MINQQQDRNLKLRKYTAITLAGAFALLAIQADKPLQTALNTVCAVGWATTAVVTQLRQRRADT